MSQNNFLFLSSSHSNFSKFEPSKVGIVVPTSVFTLSTLCIKFFVLSCKIFIICCLVSKFLSFVLIIKLWLFSVLNSNFSCLSKSLQTSSQAILSRISKWDFVWLKFRGKFLQTSNKKSLPFLSTILQRPFSKYGHFLSKRLMQNSFWHLAKFSFFASESSPQNCNFAISFFETEICQPAEQQLFLQSSARHLKLS